MNNNKNFKKIEEEEKNPFTLGGLGAMGSSKKEKELMDTEDGGDWEEGKGGGRRECKGDK